MTNIATSLQIYKFTLIFAIRNIVDKEMNEQYY